MQMKKEKFIIDTPAISTSLLSLLLLTIIASSTTTTFVECAQIPSRSFYDNSVAFATSGAAAASSEDQQHVSYIVDNSDTNSQSHSETAIKPLFSIEFYQELDKATDLNEFIERFVEKDSIDPQLDIHENVERAAAIEPKHASCMPDNTIVKLTPLLLTHDPNVLFLPECTRVKRCGGCCGSAMMSCQPTEVEQLNYEVKKYVSTSNGKMRNIGKELIVVEQHKKCRCHCRIKETDCNRYQIYREDLCRCECKNHDAREKCLGQDNKVWDEQSCRCICRDNQSCTTGTRYDESQCKCTTSNEGDSAMPVLLDRRRFIVKAVPVETDNSTIYSL